jgi:hypothetical protein
MRDIREILTSSGSTSTDELRSREDSGTNSDSLSNNTTGLGSEKVLGLAAKGLREEKTVLGAAGLETGHWGSGSYSFC